MAETGKNDPGTGDEAQDQLRGFLVELATDPAALGRFVKDPEATMADAGLPAADQSVLRSGDPAAINRRLAGGPGVATPTMMLVVDVTPGARGEPEQVSVRPFGLLLLPQVHPQIHPQQVPPQFLMLLPQVHPQVHPQQVPPQFLMLLPQLPPQIHPQQVFPQIHPQQVFPQIHPQQVVHPQLVIHPQQVVHPQLVIHPQQVVHPQLVPQQLVIHPQVFPQIQPNQ